MRMSSSGRARPWGQIGRSVKVSTRVTSPISPFQIHSQTLRTPSPEAPWLPIWDAPGQQARLVDGVGQRFLDIDVFAGGHGLCGDDGVRMVGGGHHYGVGRLEQFVVHPAVVVVPLGCGIALEDVVGVFPVHVAQADDVLALEALEHRGAAASDADTQDVEFVAGGGMPEFFA